MSAAAVALQVTAPRLPRDARRDPLAAAAGNAEPVAKDSIRAKDFAAHADLAAHETEAAARCAPNLRPGTELADLDLPAIRAHCGAVRRAAVSPVVDVTPATAPVRACTMEACISIRLGG